jgi:hypothetical protein
MVPNLHFLTDCIINLWIHTNLVPYLISSTPAIPINKAYIFLKSQAKLTLTKVLE